MTTYELQTLIATSHTTGTPYLAIGDGHSATSEFCWLLVAKGWLYHDGEAGRTGVVGVLTFVFSGVDGDDSGLNAHPSVVACDLDGTRGLWVFAGEVPAGFVLPDDAEVYTLGEPARGLCVYEGEAA